LSSSKRSFISSGIPGKRESRERDKKRYPGRSDARGAKNKGVDGDKFHLRALTVEGGGSALTESSKIRGVRTPVQMVAMMAAFRRVVPVPGR